MFFKLLNCKPEVKTAFKKRFPLSLKNCKGGLQRGHRSSGGGGVGISNRLPTLKVQQSRLCNKEWIAV